ncbi:MAG: glycine cleavage system protein GcvH [Cephaloticoccus sp.]|nr:glycine cleavage system protein GcvH [Cephaloticoccus sp.]MCF7760128.1 glycine cleavage system protein GcvH [Cephaloticoccus sp.]
MSNVPTELRYAKSHEWLKLEADGTATIGISDYAQNSLGDITYVQLPPVGSELDAGASFGVVESVKAASDVYVPVTGTVLAVNSTLDATPEVVNQDPYVAGWLIKLKLTNPAEVEGMLDAAAYTGEIG